MWKVDPGLDDVAGSADTLPVLVTGHSWRGDDGGNEGLIEAGAEALLGLLAATRAQLRVKRALDIGVSAFALVLLSPVLLLAALAVALTSRGPVVYRQQRVGLDGRRFTMLKFRSMYHDAHDRRLQYFLLNEVSGPVFKIRSDPRVTRVGRTIRKLSIDELPQLINVLRGEMSLVGPRPPLPEEYATYGPYERQRLQATPGITCIWQVSGRSTIEFAHWIEMDLTYIRTWSLALDAMILLRTIPAVLIGRGAY